MRIDVLGRCEAGGAGLRFRQAELVGLLAVRRTPVPRATVAALLWPDVEPSVARHNLRQTLVALKNGGVDCVRSEGDTLGLFDVQVDLWRLLERLEGDFEPFSVDELLPVIRGEWIFPAREALARAVVVAALRRGEAALPHDPTSALGYAEMALAQDPWLESSRSLLVRALLARGERARAEREVGTFEAQTGIVGRLRDLLRPAGSNPLARLDYDALAPNARVRLLTAAAPGLGAEGRATLANALAEATGLGAHDCALGEAALANLAMEEGDLATAEALARAAHGRAPQGKLALIRVLIRTGRLDEALGLFEDASDDPELQAGFELARGALLQRRHALPEAERAMRRALGHAQAAGGAFLVARVRQGLASVALWAGRPEAAEREIVVGLRELGGAFPGEAAGLEMALGRIREMEGRWTDARAAYIRAVAAVRRVRDPWFLAQGLTHLGDLARRRGAVDEAVVAYREAIVLRRGIGDRLGLATALKGLGQALGEEGPLREALEAYLASDDPLGGAAAHLPLARLLRDAGRREEALFHARRAAERLGRMRADAAGLSTDDAMSPAVARDLVAELEETPQV